MLRFLLLQKDISYFVVEMLMTALVLVFVFTGLLKSGRRTFPRRRTQALVTVV